MNYEAKALSQSHQAIIQICYDQKKYFHWLLYRKSLHPYLCVCISRKGPKVGQGILDFVED